MRRRVPKALLLASSLAGLAALGWYGAPYLKQLGPPQRCWEVQEIDGRIYKVNPCTGQFLLLGDAPAR